MFTDNKIIQNKNKIIWAVDPTENIKESENLIKELRIWAESLDCAVLPVSIISKPNTLMPTDVELPLKEKLETVIQKTITAFLKKLHIKNSLPTKIIMTDTDSTREMALTLARFAEKNGAILMIANTRSKKSWDPFRIGSFTETLVTTSRVPILLINPKTKLTKKISSVLFPTDFSKDSKNALLKLSPWISTLKSKLILYNQIETPAMYSTDFEGVIISEKPSMDIKELSHLRQVKASQWTNTLNKSNIKNSILIEPQKKYLATEILNTAKKNNVSLIAMAKESGRISQMLLGSVAKDVIIKAHCPVLLFYRPKRVHNQKSVRKQRVLRNNLKKGVGHDTISNYIS